MDWEQQQLIDNQNRNQDKRRRSSIDAEEFFEEDSLPASVLYGSLNEIDPDTTETHRLIPDVPNQRDLGSPDRPYRRIYSQSSHVPTSPSVPTSSSYPGSMVLVTSFSPERLYVYTGSAWKYVALTP